MKPLIPYLPPLDEQQMLRIKAKTYLLESTAKPEDLATFQRLPRSAQASAAHAYLNSGSRSPLLGFSEAVNTLDDSLRESKEIASLSDRVEKVYPGSGSMAAGISRPVAAVLVMREQDNPRFDIVGAAQRMNARLITTPERYDLDTLRDTYDRLPDKMKAEVDGKDKSMPFSSPMQGLMEVRKREEHLRTLAGVGDDKSEFDELDKLIKKYPSRSIDSYGDKWRPQFDEGRKDRKIISARARTDTVMLPHVQRDMDILGRQMSLDIAGQSRREGWTYQKAWDEFSRRAKYVEEAKTKRPPLGEFVAKVGDTKALEAHRALSTHPEIRLPGLGGYKEIEAKYNEDPEYGVDAIHDLKRVFGIAVMTTPQWLRENEKGPKAESYIQAYAELPPSSQAFFQKQDKTSPLFQPQREIAEAGRSAIQGISEARLDRRLAAKIDYEYGRKDSVSQNQSNGYSR